MKNTLYLYITTILMLFSTQAIAQNTSSANREEMKSIWNWQLRSNVLFDFVLVPNLGIAVQHKGTELQLDYIGTWISHDITHHYWCNYGLQMEARYYLPYKGNKYKRDINNHNLGQHVGLYAQMATYDFEFGETGYQCRHLNDSYGLGISYGYQVYLTQDLNLDLTAGLGYFHTKYNQYEPGINDRKYYRTASKKADCFCPTKIEATLVWKLIPNPSSKKQKTAAR